MIPSPPSPDPRDVIRASIKATKALRRELMALGALDAHGLSTDARKEACKKLSLVGLLTLALETKPEPEDLSEACMLHRRLGQKLTDDLYRSGHLHGTQVTDKDLVLAGEPRQKERWFRFAFAGAGSVVFLFSTLGFAAGAVKFVSGYVPVSGETSVLLGGLFAVAFLGAALLLGVFYALLTSTFSDS